MVVCTIVLNLDAILLLFDTTVELSSMIATPRTFISNVKLPYVQVKPSKVNTASKTLLIELASRLGTIVLTTILSVPKSFSNTLTYMIKLYPTAE